MKTKQIIFPAVLLVLTLAACNNSATQTKAKQNTADSNSLQAAKSKTNGVYTCPMDTDYHSDKPGTCPKCGMTLVKTK